ncbi:hypothetical protein JOC25_002400 [Solibacillus kalamii]|uniref:Uncharacterized protein n=1 Tax=Solibacillus kalamii TaxID=1748298 RepID=A0ABX3ZG12_9BACL|nr:hypothetical protein [Solibacillus kalamii]MBM7665907.1 hypothetical protein [Solibacillus kalamii]OUZ38662.1 hypothetical protein CBM15_11130 [Solibacillus kalamii]
MGNIFEWGNPPYDLKDYNEKPYVFCNEGSWSSVFLNDLLHYLKLSIKKEQEVELIRFWVGESDWKLKKLRFTLEEIEYYHLENITNQHYIRVSFD